MQKDKKNVALLSASQAVFMTNQSILLATNALAGYALATDKAFATLPVTAYIVGAAMTTVPASLLMRRLGRRLLTLPLTASFYRLLGVLLPGFQRR